MHKSTKKNEIINFSVTYSVLHIQHMWSAWSFFIPGVMPLSPAGCESTWFFSWGVFQASYLQNWHYYCYWISAYFPSLWDCRVQVLPSLPVLWLSGDSPSRVEAYLPRPNCLKGGGQGQHVCSDWYTCLLKRLSSGDNKERECTAWSCLPAISYVSSPFKKYYIPFWN